MWTTILSLFTSAKSWIYIVLGVVVIGGAGGAYYYIKLLQNERYILKTELLTVSAAYKENIKELDKLKYTHEKSLSLLAIQHKEELEKVQKLTTIKEEIKNVKKDDDAPVANILRDTIHRLQQ